MRWFLVCSCALVLNHKTQFCTTLAFGSNHRLQTIGSCVLAFHYILLSNSAVLLARLFFGCRFCDFTFTTISLVLPSSLALFQVQVQSFLMSYSSDPQASSSSVGRVSMGGPGGVNIQSCASCGALQPAISNFWLQPLCVTCAPSQMGFEATSENFREWEAISDDIRGNSLSPATVKRYLSLIERASWPIDTPFKVLKYIRALPKSLFPCLL